MGFGAARELWKVPIRGGPPVSLCKTRVPFGAHWGPDNRIVFSKYLGGVREISAEGGDVKELTMLDKENGEVTHRLPTLLPGGEAVLFTIRKRAIGDMKDSQIAVQSLVTGERKVLIENGADAHYLPTGHLVFVRLGTLMAVPFDLARLEVTGGPFGILEGVVQSANRGWSGFDSGAAMYSFSETGSLVYLPGGMYPDEQHSLVWVDREGTIEPLGAPKLSYIAPRLSPDGRRVAVFTGQSAQDIWVYDISRDTMTLLASEGDHAFPSWTPDGSRVAFNSSTTGGPWNLSWRLADLSGPVERLTTSPDVQMAPTPSPDGKTLAFASRGDIWTLSPGEDATPRRLTQTQFYEHAPAFSPDGTWLAYTSNETGQNEVYVQAYPGPRISTDGGRSPAWASDGRELFYRDDARTKMIAVDVATEPTFSASRPRVLFEAPSSPAEPGRGYDVSSDGERFLMVQYGEKPGVENWEAVVVLNWFEEVKRLASIGD